MNCTFRLIHILPTFRPSQNVFDGFQGHGFALVVAAIEDHLVGACAAFETVFALRICVGGGAVGGGDGGYY